MGRASQRRQLPKGSRGVSAAARAIGRTRVVASLAARWGGAAAQTVCASQAQRREGGRLDRPAVYLWRDLSRRRIAGWQSDQVLAMREHRDHSAASITDCSCCRSHSTGIARARPPCQPLATLYPCCACEKDVCLADGCRNPDRSGALGCYLDWAHSWPRIVYTISDEHHATSHEHAIQRPAAIRAGAGDRGRLAAPGAVGALRAHSG